MQLFSRLPERQLRLVRWGLLIGWLLLIVSLLLPLLSLPEGLVPPCSLLIDRTVSCIVSPATGCSGARWCPWVCC
jgi:hypothetical protein